VLVAIFIVQIDPFFLNYLRHFRCLASSRDAWRCAERRRPIKQRRRGALRLTAESSI